MPRHRLYGKGGEEVSPRELDEDNTVPRLCTDRWKSSLRAKKRDCLWDALLEVADAYRFSQKHGEGDTVCLDQ